MEHTWEAKLENKKKLVLDDVKYIFDQAEKFLIDINESHKLVVDRTNTLLVLYTTIISALIGFNIDRIESNSLYDNITNSIWILITYLIIGIILLVRNIRPTNYMGIGTPPINLFDDIFFKDSIPKKDRIIRMYVSEIERYQFRIQKNSIINNKKWKIFTISIYWLLITPIFFLLSYLFILVVT